MVCGGLFAKSQLSDACPMRVLFKKHGANKNSRASRGIYCISQILGV